jgi:hypothetical protein
MAYASAGENYLYIQGGFTEVGKIRTQSNQLFALDLTVQTWSTSRPPWLAPPSLHGTVSPTSSDHSMTVSKDGDNLYIWDPIQVSPWWTYSISQKFWDYFQNPLNITKALGIRNAVDMNTGNVYIPAGSNEGTMMIMNTPRTNAVPTSFMPTELMPVPVVQESFVWSTYRNTFLHYGGRSMDAKTSNPNLTEFSPSSSRWRSVVLFTHVNIRLFACGNITTMIATPVPNSINF